MVFRAKNQLLYGDPVNQIENWAQSTLHYFWKDSFDVREDFLAGIEQGEEDMSRFSEQHKNWLEKLRQGVYLDSLYNFWDPSLGPAPDFSQLVDGDLSGVGPKTKVNPVGKMIHSLFNNQNV